MTDYLSLCNRFSGNDSKRWRAILAVMREIDSKRVGERLRALQKHLELVTVDAFAAAVGAERSATSNWLHGYNLPRVPQMARLIDLVPGLTLDWIYLGKADALPVKLAIKLEALLEGMEVPVVSPEPASPSGGSGGGRARRRVVRSSAT